MSSKWGRNLLVTIYGRSHDECIGVKIEGLPAGEIIDMVELQEFLDRRSPGKDGVSQRKESDVPVILSGIRDGLTDGKMLEAVIYNEDVKSIDYVNLKYTPRPGHADYPAYIKFSGAEDMRGGGRFSGRLTAPLCIAGGIAKQILSRRQIEIEASLSTDYLAEKDDSVGGIVSCRITGLPIGIGDALFDGIDGSIASAVFGIPAVKGIEFGAGFRSASMKGSENNDEYYLCDGEVCCKTNNAGGVLGGMTTGMPLIFNVAFKPTPSIAKEQRTVNLKTMEETVISISGRHDPCVAVRAVPVVEAVAALAILDAMPCNDFSSLRNRIDIIDRNIACLLKSRFELTDAIGDYKRAKGMSVTDASREHEVLENVSSVAGKGLEKEVSEIYSEIFEMSKKRQ